MKKLDLTKENYAAQRKLRGTQTEVANALGLSRETISRRERGDIIVTREMLIALIATPNPLPVRHFC